MNGVETARAVHFREIAGATQHFLAQLQVHERFPIECKPTLPLLMPGLAGLLTQSKSAECRLRFGVGNNRGRERRDFSGLPSYAG